MSAFPRDDWAKLWQPPADKADGETTEEIARRLGKSVDSVRRKLREQEREGKLTTMQVRRRALGGRVSVFTVYKMVEETE